jgi:hypothetical protein
MLDEAMEYFLQDDHAEGGVELIVVDDGSGDETREVARELSGKWEERGSKKQVEVRVVRLLKNRGKGGAVQHVSRFPTFPADIPTWMVIWRRGSSQGTPPRPCRPRLMALQYWGLTSKLTPLREFFIQEVVLSSSPMQTEQHGSQTCHFSSKPFQGWRIPKDTAWWLEAEPIWSIARL